MFLSRRNVIQRRIVIGWSLFAGLAVLWDLSWCFVFRHLQSPGVDHDWRIVWAAYGRADHRFLSRDPYLVVIELVTGLCSFLNFYVAYQLLRGKRTRAVVALFALSIMELYGTVIYFGSELLNGFADIDTASFVHTWIMFGALNSLWLVFPGWCVYALAFAQPDRSDEDARSSRRPVINCIAGH